MLLSPVYRLFVCVRYLWFFYLFGLWFHTFLQDPVTGPMGISRMCPNFLASNRREKVFQSNSSSCITELSVTSGDWNILSIHTGNWYGTITPSQAFLKEHKKMLPICSDAHPVSAVVINKFWACPSFSMLLAPYHLNLLCLLPLLFFPFHCTLFFSFSFLLCPSNKDLSWSSDLHTPQVFINFQNPKNPAPSFLEG